MKPVGAALCLCFVLFGDIRVARAQPGPAAGWRAGAQASFGDIRVAQAQPGPNQSAAPAVYAGVELQFTPMSMSIYKPLPVKDIGPWTLMVRNATSAAIHLTPEQIMMAVPADSHGRITRFLSPSYAKYALTQRQGQSRTARAAQWISWGLIGASAITGFGPIAANKTIIAALASGAGVGAAIHDRLAQQVPSLSPFLDPLLSASFDLQPGEARTFTVFAAKMPSPETLRTVLR